MIAALKAHLAAVGQPANRGAVDSLRIGRPQGNSECMSIVRLPGFGKRLSCFLWKVPTDAKENHPVGWGVLKGYSIDIVVDTISHNPRS